MLNIYTYTKMPTFTNYTFSQLEQMILERDEQIEKLESKMTF